MRVTHVRIALVVLLSFMANAARADLADILGVKEAAEKAGREAAIEVAKGMDVATRNLAMMTNQFGQLIDDFYGGDQVKRNKAQKILEGVFGRSLSATDNVKLQVTASFDGNVTPADRLEADLWLFPNIDNDALKRIAAAGASFHGTPIKASAPPAKTVNGVREAVLAKATEFGVRGGQPNRRTATRAGECNAKFPAPVSGGMVPTPQPRQPKEQEKFEACVAEKEALDLTEVVMATLTQPDTLTTQGTVTRDLPGGRFVAVVANKRAIEKLRDVVKITFWVHQVGEPSKRIGAFREVVRHIDASDMLKNVVPTPLEATPELCYVFVDLKLDAIMGAAYLTPTGGK